MHRVATILLIALTAFAGLAACGGSDDGSSDDGKLTRSQLAAKADSICKTGEEDAKAVKAPRSFDDPDASTSYFEQIVPLHQKQTDDLAALEPDDEAKADWDKFMATQNANNRLLKQILAKAKAKDPSGQTDLQQFTAKSQDFATAAKKIGSGECAGTT